MEGRVDPLSSSDQCLPVLTAAASAALSLSRVETAPLPAVPSPNPGLPGVPPGSRFAFPAALAGTLRPIKLIGLGGMGVVFLAEDPTLRRPVAVKVAQAAADPVHRERFLREAAALARLKHPNLPKVFTFGSCAQGPYMVLEYVDGRPMHQLPPSVDPLPPLLQVASALEEIHRLGFVHRDVKPDNIILSSEGRAVLVDFGLLLHPDLDPLTRQGRVVGTMNYVAPEVLAFERPTAASDWYAWGVTLYALLERKFPFPVETLARVARQGKVLAPKFMRIEASSPVAELLRRLLALDPGARPRTRQAIERILAGLPPRASEPPPRPRSHPIPAALAAPEPPDWFARWVVPFTRWLARRV